MKKKLSILLLLIVVVSALIACVACKGKTEPVYQGMTIARNNTYALADSATPLYSNGQRADDTPNNGEFVPADDDGEIDKDVEDIITIEVEGDDTVKYYVKPNETFIVQVHISNPDDYEIQSFTLNGQKYANYMFRQGSTMELLLLEVQAPATSGYLDLTIDAIKYIDGTEIKDVRMDGSKTIKAGVAYQHEPTATVTSKNIDTTKATFTFNVTDTQDIIGKNAITAYLTDGDKKIAEKTLKVGSNTITFDNLTMGKTYQYGIATSYDLIDGYGERARWLLSNKFTTLSAFAITNGVATQNSVTFDVSKTGDSGTITNIKLLDYQTNSLVATLNNFTNCHFDNLLSNHSYKIQVDFTYTINGGAVNDSTATAFTTLAKTAPTVNVANTTSTQTSIGFDVTITDVDNILTINKIELYRGATLAQTATSLDVREFADLLSNNEYTVKVTYSYDLNDGNGVHTQTATANKKTLAKTAPTVAIQNVTSTQTAIGFDVITTDVDNILSIDKIELYLGKTLAKTATSVDVREFADLLSNNEYTVKVTYSYDLNDGDGVHTQTVNASKTTLAKTAPTVVIENTASTQTAIGFDVVITDVDNILSIDKIELYRGTAFVDLATSLDVREFADLLSNNEYTVKVTYSYDLNDGNGVHTQTATANKKTVAKTTPTVNVANTTSTQTSIGFDVTTTDVDNILSIDKIELYRGTTLAQTATNVDVREFIDLLSNNEYTVKVTYSYDLNDGNGVHTQTVNASKTTLAKTVPIVAIENTTSTQTTLGFGIVTTDVDGILNIIAVELYNGETLVKTLDKTSTTFNASGLTTGTMYTIKVTYTYDLNDGDGVHTEYVTTNYPTLVESVAVTEVSLVNNNQVRLGEELNLRVYFDNPNNVQLTNIYVNGVKVQVSGGDRKTYAIVRFATTESGLIDFYVDRVDYNFAGVEVNQHVDSLAHVTFPVFDDLDVKFEGVSASPYEYTGYGIYLYFDNPQGYKVYKINDSTDFTQISDHEFYISFGTYGTHKLTSIEYGYDNYGTTTQALNYNPTKYDIGSFIPVYTTDDFLNMSGSNYYILMNDLDMRNVNVAQQIALTGYLNGNGHTIRGLHNVIDTSSQNYFDIFKGGSIYDVNFTELYFSIVNSKTETQRISLFGNVRLYNCTVSGDFNASGNIELYKYWVNGYYKQDLTAQYNDSNTFNLNTTINGVDVSNTTTKVGVKIEPNNAIEITDDGVIYYYCGQNASMLINCYNKEITQHTICANTIKIWASAFYGCSSLTSIVIPDGVTSIDNYTFYNCSSLTSVTIGDSVTTIGSSAFYNCSSLTSIVIPDSVTTKGSNAFNGCSGLENVVIGNGVTSLNGFNFQNNTNLKSIVIGNSVTSIGYSAFSGCSSLTSITIPDSVTSIGNYAFSSCSNLTSVYYTGDIASWCNIDFGSNPMSYATNLYINNEILSSDIVIPSSVTKIPSYTFKGSAITSVVIPDSVTTIGEDAFSGCSSLVSITLPFVGSSATATTASSSTLFGYIFGTSSYTGGTSTQQSYGIWSTTYYIPASLKSVTITGGNLLYGAFYNCRSLTSVTIGDSVTSIGEYAFRGCSSLTSITIPDSVTSIGSAAFSGCSSLESITLPFVGGSIKTSSDTYQYPFGDMFGTSSYTGGVATKQYYYGNSTSSTTYSTYYIPSSLRSVTITGGNILYGAFYNCSSLTSITIPDSVTTIGLCAFYNCSSLTSVYYTGTADNWAKISIGSSNSNLTNATRYYYSESEPELNADGTAYNGNYWYYSDNNEIVVWVYNKENN